MLKLLKYVYKKSLETEFLIAICCPTGDKWQSKSLFLAIFDRLAIVKSVFDCRLHGVFLSPAFFREISRGHTGFILLSLGCGLCCMVPSKI